MIAGICNYVDFALYNYGTRLKYFRIFGQQNVIPRDIIDTISGLLRDVALDRIFNAYEQYVENYLYNNLTGRDNYSVEILIDANLINKQKLELILGYEITQYNVYRFHKGIEYVYHIRQDTLSAGNKFTYQQVKNWPQLLDAIIKAHPQIIHEPSYYNIYFRAWQ